MNRRKLLSLFKANFKYLLSALVHVASRHDSSRKSQRLLDNLFLQKVKQEEHKEVLM